jgi:hypothetical protein
MRKRLQISAFAIALGCAGAAGAQTRAPREGEVASDPIRCWWKADTTAIRVGERFGLVLTCGVIETSTITVVPNVNQLEPGAISLTPFEAVSGTRREDVVVPPWRYVQFEYEMRLLNEGFFGQDVSIPSLTVTYNLQSGGAGDTSRTAQTAPTAEGRDQTYMLPPLPMRVLSIVPRTAEDIRDASGQSFATVETRRFRSALAMVGAGIGFAFAVVLAAFALVRAAGRWRVRHPQAVKPVPQPSLLRGCLRELGAVRAAAAREGWTPELKGRALAALRVAGAVALGRSVTQQYVDGQVRERPGQVLVRAGLLRRKRALLSASTTPGAIAAGLENGRVHGAQAKVNLQQIGDALQAFSAAAYGRTAGAASLDASLDAAISAIRRVRASTFWPVRTAQAVARSFTGF